MCSSHLNGKTSYHRQDIWRSTQLVAVLGIFLVQQIITAIWTAAIRSCPSTEVSILLDPMFRLRPLSLDEPLIGGMVSSSVFRDRVQSGILGWLAPVYADFTFFDTSTYT